MRLISASRTVSIGHRIPSYDGICSSPHGHNLQVVVSAEPLDNDALYDFKELDRQLAAVLSDWDHAMILSIDDPLAQVLRDMGFRVVTLDEEPSTENMAEAILFDLLTKATDPSRVRILNIDLQETDKYGANVDELRAGHARRVEW